MNWKYIAVILVVIVVAAVGLVLVLNRPAGHGIPTLTSSTVTTSTSTAISTTSTTTSTTITASNLTITFKQINSTWYEFIIPYPKVNNFTVPLSKTYVLHNVSWYDVVTETPIYCVNLGHIIAPVPQWIGILNASGDVVGQFWFSGYNPGQSMFTSNNYKFVGNDLILYVKTQPVQPGMMPGIVPSMLVPGKTYRFLLMAGNFAGYFNATYV